MRFVLFGFVASLVLSCTPGPTAIRFRLEYESSWTLSTFVLGAEGREQRLQAVVDGVPTRELVVTVPDSLLERDIVYSLQAYRRVAGSEELWATGSARVTAHSGEIVDATIVLARTACAVWCNPGAKSCRSGGVAVCEAADGGCPRFAEPVACATGQSCSLGECQAACVNECAAGETRCAGPLGVEICGQADSDSCLDWQTTVLCSAGQVCSHGRCAPTCTSECTAGAVRCRDGGVSSCADANNDGCFEWGPPVSCTSDQSCEGRIGIAGQTGVARCASRAACTNTCNRGTCDGDGAGAFFECGNFDLDSCTELSSGVSCGSPSACEEGLCEDATGCMRRARECTMQPEPICLSTTLMRVFDPVGSCNSVTGSCEYAQRDVTCRSCPSDCANACASVTCPPLPSVATQHHSCYVSGSGTCTDGSCSYVTRDGACEDGDACTMGDACSEGICQSGTRRTCAAGRAADCRAGVARTYGMLGMCSAGECQYPEVSAQTCANGCDGAGCAAMAASGPTNGFLAAGANHTCVVGADESVWCWGNGTSGELGDNTMQSSSMPVRVALGGARNVAAGGQHTCAINGEGQVACWGEGESGQLGDGTGLSANRPTPVDGVTGAVGLATGANHSCCLQGGGLWCWGRGTEGQLGSNITDRRLFPVMAGGAVMATQISLGAYHSCAVDAARRLWCWGNNSSLQLGRNGTSAHVSVPTVVDGIDDAAIVRTGFNHTCVVRTGGHLTCFGSNDMGESGAAPNAATVRSEIALANVRDVALGSSHTCALTTAGAVYCFGTGQNGVLGGAPMTVTPVAISGLTDVVSVTAGEVHTCARERSGRVLCWGGGSLGQLGPRGSASTSVPVEVPGLPAPPALAP